MNMIQLHKIREASKVLAGLSEEKMNEFLVRLKNELLKNSADIISANKKDLLFARRDRQSQPFLDRLKIDKKGIFKLAVSIESARKLNSGIGEIIETRKLRSGIQLRKVRTPIGVVFVIFESRPEVVIDVVVLCLKSGNAAILKSGSEAKYTAKSLFVCVRRALVGAGISRDAFWLLPIKPRKEIYSLLKQTSYIDLVIARGGYGLVRTIKNQSRIPVLAHSAGGARIYVDESADLEMATRIIINAKTSRPSACNSLDTVLVHEAIAKGFIPQITKLLADKRVNVIYRMGFDKWDKEFLTLTCSIRIVAGVYEALDFISRYGKGHTEGIIAGDQKTIDIFSSGVDSAAIFINCSTRFHDGGQFGMGTEMGIATGKLHARGPVGLKELTTYKWIVTGNGQIRI